jgi:hypothetical protein
MPAVKSCILLPLSKKSCRSSKITYPKRGKNALFEKFFSQKWHARNFWQAI